MVADVPAIPVRDGNCGNVSGSIARDDSLRDYGTNVRGQADGLSVLEERTLRGSV